jgi:Tat protein translocase TatB subunit
MFEFAFSKMVLVGLVALVVLGPERLPTVARQAGLWLGKMRRYVDDVKADFNRQAELDELKKIGAEVTSAAQSLKDGLQTSINETQTEFNSISGAFSSSVSTPSNEPQTDWDKVYATRRTREKIKERRKDRNKELGLSRPRFRR